MLGHVPDEVMRNVTVPEAWFDLVEKFDKRLEVHWWSTHLPENAVYTGFMRSFTVSYLILSVVCTVLWILYRVAVVSVRNATHGDYMFEEHIPIHRLKSLSRRDRDEPAHNEKPIQKRLSAQPRALTFVEKTSSHVVDDNGSFNSLVEFAAQDSIGSAETGHYPENQMLQHGYKRVFCGFFVHFLWDVLGWISQGFLICLIFRKYVTADPDLTYAFFWGFYPSAALMFILVAFPPHMIWFLLPCDLDDATHILVQELDEDAAAGQKEARGWNYFTLRWLGSGDGKGHKHTVVKVLRAAGFQEKRFEYNCTTYMWKAEDGRYRRSGAVDTFNAAGLATKDVNAMHQAEKNRHNVLVPSVMRTLLQEFRQGFTVYQVYSAYKDLLHGRWNEAIATIFVAMGFSTWRAMQMVRKGQQEVRELAHMDGPVEVMRDQEWVTLSLRELVPRDVIRLGLGPVPCDCVVLEGSCVADECTLTGEPTPIQKVALPAIQAQQEEVKTSKVAPKSVLHAGSEIIQGSNCLCVVIATGTATMKGRLIRTVLFPSSATFKFDNELPYVVIACFLYSMITWGCLLLNHVNLAAHGHWYYYRVKALDVACGCMFKLLHPLLPLSFSAGYHVASLRLKKHGIRCISPPRLSLAGKMHIAVFDKTGTLTHLGMELVFMRPVSEMVFTSMLWIDSGVEAMLPRGTPTPVWLIGMATAHSVDWVNDAPVGPALDISMFYATGFKFEGTHPVRNVKVFSGRGQEVDVLRVLEFDQDYKSSGAIVRLRKETGEKAGYVFIKGSPEKMAKVSTVPSNYASVAEQAAKDGYYALSLAYKEVPLDALDMLCSASRNDLETDLQLVGLLLYQNHVKPESRPALQELRAGLIRPVMCTGDNVLTGVKVAKDAGMLSEDEMVYVGALGDEGEVIWKGEYGERPPNDEALLSAELAIDGETYEVLIQQQTLRKYLMQVRVFGRMGPEQKVDLIRQYQAQGFIVAMCGDGGNDCGALRAAHVGVALTNAEASIVAPFSSAQDRSIISVVQIAKAGRGCLATNLTCYKVFFVCGLFATFHEQYGHVITGKWPSELQRSYTSYLFPVVTVLALSSTVRECTKLTNRRIPSSLFSPVMLFGISVPFLVYMISCLLTWLCLLPLQSWYQDYDPAIMRFVVRQGERKVSDHWDPASSFCISSFMLIGITLAFVSNDMEQPIYTNCPIMIAMGSASVLSALFTFTGPSKLTCHFRVNCDNKSLSGVDAYKLDSMIEEVMSTTNVAGCFLSPHIIRWVMPWRFPETAHVPAYLPTKSSEIPCHPPRDSGLPDDVNPNNIFPLGWKLVLCVLILLAGGLQVWFIKVGNEPFCNWLRSKSKRRLKHAELVI